MVIDSIMTNQITAITGFGGTGKSLLAVASALHLMDYCGYERIVVMFNPEKARGGKDMGFYEGSMLKKALKHNIGNMLSSKFGSEGDLEDMLRTDRIRLIPIVDGRGMEVGNNEILYVTEAQNTNNDLMELVLTRPSAQAKVIIEGDDKAQVDNRLFEHEKNGLRNMINAYKGESIFGYTHLTTIYRSKVAELAQRLRED
jgi:predicted ribonuclease YlaK